MIIIKRELAFSRTSFIIWGTILFFITLMFFGSFAAIEIDENYLKIMEQMPEALKAAFMIDILNYADLHGFFAGNSYPYLMILVGIYTAILAATMFSKEEDKRTAEFLYTKPVTRGNIFSQKLISVLLNVIGMNLILLAGIFLTLVFIIAKDFNPTIFLTLVLGMFLACLTIAGMGLLISNFTSSEKLGLTLGISFVMISYVLNIMSGIVDAFSFLKYASFFYYLDPASIVVSEQIPWGKYGILLSVFMITTYLAYIRFLKKDISL